MELILGTVDGKTSCLIGNVLGGGFDRVNLIPVRGNRRDFDKWKEMGNPGWSYKDILPYFKKLETAQVLQQDNDFRGTSGPVNISNLGFT